MTDEMTIIQPREAEQLTKWAFRAAQVPAGYTTAAMPLVRYAETFHQNGLAQLMACLPALDGKAVQPPTLLRETGAMSQFDGHGQSNLIVGPAVADYVAGQPTTPTGWAATVTHTASDTPLLEQLIVRAASRGTPAALRYRLPDLNEACLVAVPGQGVPWCIHVDPTLWAAFLQGWPAALAEPLPVDTWQIAIRPAGTDQAVEGWLDSLLGGQPAGYSAQTPQQRQERWVEAQRQGLAVPIQLYKQVKTFGEQILIPKEPA